MERSTGIEPAFRAWEARVLPLDDDRMYVGMTLATMERVTGIEPALAAWKAEVLPLDDTRDVSLRGIGIRTRVSMLPRMAHEPRHAVPRDGALVGT